MTKLTFYFGNSSNGPEKFLGDTWKTGVAFESSGKKYEKKSKYKAFGHFENKNYKLIWKGKNFNYNNEGKLTSGFAKSYFLYENNKLKQKWLNINKNIGHYNNKFYSKGDLSTLEVFNNYIAKYYFGKDDTLKGNKGNDNLWGYSGNDKISGGSGNDILNGGNGNDHLAGGKGKDKLIGGKGKDIFKLSSGKGYDLIQDFKNKQDKIYIGSMKKLKLKNKGKDVYIYKGKDLLAKVKKAKGDLSKKGKYFV